MRPRLVGHAGGLGDAGGDRVEILLDLVEVPIRQHAGEGLDGR